MAVNFQLVCSGLQERVYGNGYTQEDPNPEKFRSDNLFACEMG